VSAFKNTLGKQRTKWNGISSHTIYALAKTPDIATPPMFVSKILKSTRLCTLPSSTYAGVWEAEADAVEEVDDATDEVFVAELVLLTRVEVLEVEVGRALEVVGGGGVGVGVGLGLGFSSGAGALPNDQTASVT